MYPDLGAVLRRLVVTSLLATSFRFYLSLSSSIHKMLVPVTNLSRPFLSTPRSMHVKFVNGVLSLDRHAVFLHAANCDVDQHERL